MVTSSNAGSATVSMTDAHHPGIIEFHNSSTAANGNFNVVSSTGTGAGTLTFLNGTSSLNSLIFGAQLSFQSANGVVLGTDTVTITTTSNTADIANPVNADYLDFILGVAILVAMVINVNVARVRKGSGIG